MHANSLQSLVEEPVLGSVLDIKVTLSAHATLGGGATSGDDTVNILYVTPSALDGAKAKPVDRSVLPLRSVLRSRDVFQLLRDGEETPSVRLEIEHGRGDVPEEVVALDQPHAVLEQAQQGQGEVDLRVLELDDQGGKSVEEVRKAGGEAGGVEERSLRTDGDGHRALTRARVVLGACAQNDANRGLLPRGATELGWSDDGQNLRSGRDAREGLHSLPGGL